MLLLPALLLLMFRGPSLDRAQLAEKLGQADSRFSIADFRFSDCSSRVGQQSGRAALLALGTNPAFTRAVAELLRSLPFEAASDMPQRPADFSASIERTQLPNVPITREQAGFISAQRSRDGPILL